MKANSILMFILYLYAFLKYYFNMELTMTMITNNIKITHLTFDI